MGDSLASERPLVTAIVNALANAVVTIALVGELGAVFANVISRSLFDTPFLWSDEVAKLALSTIAFVGGALAYAQGHHAFVRVCLNALVPPYLDEKDRCVTRQGR
jgi:TRAP-type C4-dicarboxylate transport system permease small subunit